MFSKNVMNFWHIGDCMFNGPCYYEIYVSMITCAKIINTGCFVEPCQSPLVVFAAARIVDFDMLHMHLRQLVYRFLDFTITKTKSVMFRKMEYL